MTNITLRSLLLLTSAITLLGCDDQGGDNADVQTNEAYPTIIGYYTPSTQPTKKTLSGSYLAGQHAQMNHDWEKASEYFEDILTHNPDDREIENRVMALSLGSGNYDRSISMSKKIVINQKDEPLAQLIVALDEFKKGQYKEAETRILKVKQDGLGSAIMPLIRAWCEAGQGKTDINTLKDSPSFLYQSVLIADYTGDTEAIKKLAQTYNFTRTPTPISGLVEIADVFAKHGEITEAKEIYSALRNAIPDQTGDIGVKLKKIAEEKPIETPKVTPQEGLARALLDTARLLANGYEESAVLFTHMSRFLDPQRPDTLELLAQFSAGNHRYQTAINYLSKIDPNNSESQSPETISRQIALLLELDNQKDEAIRVLKDLVDKNNNVDAQIQIGDIYRQDEKYKDALTAYNKAASMLGDKIPQEHWQLLFSRGIANERLSNWDQAEKDLSTALLYEPDQPYILNYLGYTWADQGRNLDKAIEMIEKAARLKPDDGSIIDSLGWVYFRMERYADSVKTLESAIELQPYEAEINDHLGDAYWQVGRKKEARFQWKRAISFTKDDKLIEKIQAKITDGLPQSNTVQNTLSDKLPDKLVDNK
ncbi:MAG: tetratricopeptide repeat protein [Alphaproteobacteria bacterium]|nr:tetratricopeptide repeat protein [Alphaproteobacteria bacterium]MCB1551211.1 tetratricopeptide repeat protein [Alphaproteobacteria bacterium]MCB9985217.1 tetratricopeptide repeat protein [Micavibrio sp.]HRK98104.1 tetratricopeptide repeat protein [Alphaproteobacteria bacterium]